MTCSEVRDRVAPFLDGQLSEIEAREVAEHLDGCETCRHLVLGLGAVPLGPRVPASTRPPEFWGTMDRALAEAARRPPSTRTRVSAWFRAPVSMSRGTAFLVLAALVAAIGLHLLRGAGDAVQPLPLPLQASAPSGPGNGAIAPVSHTPVRHHY